MNKLILTKGLPASGKTTWANEQVAGSNGKIININKDDLRGMLHAGKGSKYRESFVIEVQETLTKLAFEAGHDVIWSDTNLNPIHENRARTLSDCVEIVDFTDVSLDKCILRDHLRASPVGEKAIRDQYNKWLRKAPEILVQDESLPPAIIVDQDGTISHITNRSPFDWGKVKQDTPDEFVIELIKNYHSLGYEILVVTGRDGSCKELTREWLNENNVPFSQLFTREAGDSRKDSVIKEEIFFNEIYNKWNIRFVLDDRDQVVDVWRKIGLKCFQVAPGNF